MNPNSNYFVRSSVILIYILLFTHTNAQTFCSSMCASRVDACYGVSQNQCYACSASMFELNSNNGTCVTKNQHAIQFYQLKNSFMDISTYSTNKPVTQACSIYKMSGQYVSGDYIEKTFTGIPLNHYQLVVRFGIGHIGTWNPTDTMELKIDGHTYSWQYNICPQVQDICTGSPTDCFKIRQFIITHDSPNVTIRFSSQITQTNPLVQYWGVKDLVIGIRTCHQRCATCFGPNYADCSSCEQGFYLLGNLCVPHCQFLTIQDKRICTTQCPSGYFNNGNKLCQKCQNDCLMCSSQNSCQVWSGNKSGLIWEQNKPFWIFLVVVGFLIFLFLLWKLVLKKFFLKPIEDQNQMKKHMVTENRINQSKQKSSSSSQDKEKQKQKNNEKEKAGKKFPTGQYIFEQVGLQWIQQLQPAPITDNNQQGHLKKRKKRKVKPIIIEDHTNGSQPSLYELEATNQNLKL